MKNTRNRILGALLASCLVLVACQPREAPKAIFGPGEWNLNNGTIVTEVEAARLAGLTASSTEMNKLAGVTGGTVTASKALVVDSNKDLSALRNLTLTNLDAGASGTAGSVDVFPATAAKGKTTFTAANNAGDTTTTINTAAQAGARTYTIPDAGASANVLLTTGTATATSATTTEIDKVAGVTGGTTSASKALVVDANKSLDTLSLVELKLGASGSGVALTTTGTQLNQITSSFGTVNFDRSVKVARVALAAVDTGGGVFSWANPEAGAILVNRVILDVTTQSSGACTLDVGMTAASSTTSADNLIDGLSLATAGAYDNVEDQGTNGTSRQKVAVGKWVTGSVASGASSGLVGFAYIHYTNI